MLRVLLVLSFDYPRFCLSVYTFIVIRVKVFVYSSSCSSVVAIVILQVVLIVRLNDDYSLLVI